MGADIGNSFAKGVAEALSESWPSGQEARSLVDRLPALCAYAPNGRWRRNVKGYQIFLHSVKQVFGNFGAAVRISGVLFLVQAIATFGLDRYAMAAQQQGAPSIDMGGSLLAVLLTLVMLTTSLWIAVAWHRYILRVEQPVSILPAFHGRRLLAYFGYSLLIGIALFVPLLVLGFVAAMIGQAGMGAAILGSLVVVVPAILLTLRFCAALPAAALGEPLGLRGAWEATTGATPDFLVLALIAGVASVAIDLPIFILFGFGPIAMAWGVASLWVKTMVGASILTTIYGHYVERRSLAA